MKTLDFPVEGVIPTKRKIFIQTFIFRKTGVNGVKRPVVFPVL
jgi:hypothetical protein